MTNHKKKNNYILNFFLQANIISAICLFFSYCAHFVNPNNFIYISFFGLGFYLFLSINIAFVIFWLFFRKSNMLISLFVILLCWNRITANIQFNKSKIPENSKELLKVMTYNIRFFNYYHWENLSNIKTTDNILNLISNESPDIICFQEFFSDNSKYFNLKKINSKYPAAKFHYIKSYWNNKDFFSMAIFSKYKIINSNNIFVSDKIRNFCIYSDILYKKDTIRIINIHLQSIRLDTSDYNFLTKIKDKTNENKYLIQGSKKLIWKLKAGFQKRARESEIISLVIKNSPYPVIVCGDFNDTPASYAYNKISKNLSDSYIEKGYGIPKTCLKNFLFSRIDYILFSNYFKSVYYKVIKKKYSDHYPVITYLKNYN